MEQDKDLIRNFVDTKAKDEFSDDIFKNVKIPGEVQKVHGIPFIGFLLYFISPFHWNFSNIFTPIKLTIWCMVIIDLLRCFKVI